VITGERAPARREVDEQKAIPNARCVVGNCLHSSIDNFIIDNFSIDNFIVDKTRAKSVFFFTRRFFLTVFFRSAATTERISMQQLTEVDATYSSRMRTHVY
jgi:hypothetical protein